MIAIERAYDPRSRADGARILVESPIASRFTEAFDTADLKDAKAMFNVWLGHLQERKLLK